MKINSNMGKVEIRDQKQRYGDSHRGIFALERIEKGEKIWYCECGKKDACFTKDQLLNIIKKNPKLYNFIWSFSYMIDDDLFGLSYNYKDENTIDECVLFNHSCDPTCGFGENGCGDNVIAIRTIEPGEELTYHYGILETESCLIQGLICKCNSQNCVGKLTFDYYRDPVFVNKYFEYMSPYLKKKTLEMNHKWYSIKCYVKRYIPNDSSDDSSCDLEDWRKGLCSLKSISQDELVASFASEEHVQEHMHYLRHNSFDPNCYIIGKNVYACFDILPEVELTVDFGNDSNPQPSAPIRNSSSNDATN
ncbi:unnamed protein product [Brachionus calyciflorus]|uniref:SET domain-containing protein n=1 Tax=Brachionus calyciflorus TaxID=104777 RepID=A0A814CSU6_9BILA|nr:unnamed protein product [Brachionus calyciflorus]